MLGQRLSLDSWRLGRFAECLVWEFLSILLLHFWNAFWSPEFSDSVWVVWLIGFLWISCCSDRRLVQCGDWWPMQRFMCSWSSWFEEKVNIFFFFSIFYVALGTSSIMHLIGEKIEVYNLWKAANLERVCAEIFNSLTLQLVFAFIIYISCLDLEILALWLILLLLFFLFNLIIGEATNLTCILAEGFFLTVVVKNLIENYYLIERGSTWKLDKHRNHFDLGWQ